MVIIVKRRGHKEKFDGRKVYASCYAACLSSHLEKKYSEEVSAKVCRTVTKEIRKIVKGKKEVTSSKIFNMVVRHLRKYDKDAAFMYKTHRDIS
jgi:transcriptional regulator NrdR family protein